MEVEIENTLETSGAKDGSMRLRSKRWRDPRRGRDSPSRARLPTPGS